MPLIHNLLDLFLQHLSKWGLVWFGLIFWGSIFNAILERLFLDVSSLIFLFLAYLLGLILGLLAKYKGWVWIN